MSILIINDPLFPSYRLFLALIAFLGCVNLYSVRVNLSQALISMVNYTAIDQNNHSIQHTKPTALNYTQKLLPKEDGPFVWSYNQQSVILSSFFWGYIITQIPFSLIMQHRKFGIKQVFGWTMLLANLITLLTPLITFCGFYSHSFVLLCCIRFTIGIFQGSAMPAMHALWSKWAPPLERSRLLTLSYAGNTVALILTPPLVAVICQYINWQSVFLITGAFGLFWCVVWFVMVSNNPNENRRISLKEKAYIRHSLSDQAIEDDVRMLSVTLPWKQALLSVPNWAIMVAHCCSNFVCYVYISNLPTYFKQVMEFNVETNGLVTSIPYITFVIGCAASGFLADWLISKQILTVTHTRKLFTVTSFCLQALTFVGVGCCKGNQIVLAIFLISLGNLLGGFWSAGFVVNHIDLAPRYAGLLWAVSNTIATIPGFLSPIVVNLLTPTHTQTEWRNVFLVCASLEFFGAIFYCLFASAELQWWATIGDLKKNRLEKDNKS